MSRILVSLGVLAAVLAPPAMAQQPDNGVPTIDTILVVTENVFGQSEARRNIVFRIANGVRFTTRPGVVYRELLFRRGDPYDPELVAETERNLRRLGVFRSVMIDTVRINGKLGILVQTADGWSTQLQLNARSTGGVFTWSAGVNEVNFLGTANLVTVSYRQEPDRSALAVGSRINRLFSSQMTAAGLFDDLSDGTRGAWQVGLPFRAFADRRAFEVVGEAADQRILQFRSRSVLDADTIRYHRRAFRNGVVLAAAPIAEPGRFLRVGGALQLNREEFRLERDTAAAVPDTVRAAVGAFAEYRRANFKIVTHFNGFGRREDLDLSSWIRLTAWLAPAALGYDRTGVGPAISAGTGIPLSFGFIRLSGSASGLFTSAGLDSGRVGVRMTVGTQFLPRQATYVHVQAGAQKAPAPGGEFDLGHGIGPRSFAPHAFTGTRAVWGTVEHRAFLWDAVAGLFGFGLAAFLDYGGAWFPDQSTRAGGNVGFGLRWGPRRSTDVNIGRLDLGYRFGDGWRGSRWVLSFGRGFLF